ncbi:hypothetical protein MTR_8g103730 [Medicago truncatula]|uniref:Uncharacterized protein n=1 Tax=Medicago truncatula TaxID=3880 RepID=G7L8Z2_MEDTR|nr:hypothetical protein MTR_8g103730 [Medicago truncatula]
MVEYSSSSVSGSTLNHRTKLVCYCGVDSPLVTSWTDENPGRRFHGCGTSLFSFLFFHGCGTNFGTLTVEKNRLYSGGVAQFCCDPSVIRKQQSASEFLVAIDFKI